MKEMKDWKINGTPRQVVENITLSIGARLMFVILRGYLGKNCNKPFPSYQALTSKLGCAPKTAYRFRKELTNAGLISHETKKGKRGSNVYSFQTDIPVPTYGHPRPVNIDTSVQRRNNHIKEEPIRDNQRGLSEETQAILADLRNQYGNGFPVTAPFASTTDCFRRIH
jgi:hypothetical protein